MTTNSQTLPHFSRRRFLGAAGLGAASIALSACSTVSRGPTIDGPPPEFPPLSVDPAFGNYVSMYGPVIDEGYEIPGVPVKKIDKRFYRQIVQDPTGERPGTVVVDTSNHFLYLVREGGEAMRY